MRLQCEYGSTTHCIILLYQASPSGITCREYGPKVMMPNSIIRDLPKLFEAKQVPIRDSVKKLAVSQTFPVCHHPWRKKHLQ